MFFTSLRHRFTLVMLTASASFGMAVVAVGYLELSRALRDSTLRASSDQLAAVAPLLTERVLVEDRIGLRHDVREIQRTSPRWSAMIVVDAHGRVLAAAPQDATPPVPGDVPDATPSIVWISAPLGDPPIGAVHAQVSVREDRVRATEGAQRLAYAIAVLTVAGVLVAALMGYWLTGPLDAIRAQVERVGEGDFDVRVPTPELDDEIALLARAINRSIEAIAALRAREAAHLRGLAEVEKLAALGRLAAGVAHEVANPLAGVAGCLRRLGEPDLPPERRRRYAETALEGVERSSRVLRDLLDFARPTAAGPEPTTVAVVVGQAVAMARARKDLAPPALDAPDLDVSWPRLRVEQILLNLLLNAWRAARSSVEIRWFAQGDRVRVEIRDDGPGVAPEIASRLFEPFVTTSEPGQGTGLGLAVARAMARGMGGEVGLDREETPQGAWTVAWIELPARVQVEVPVAP